MHIGKIVIVYGAQCPDLIAGSNMLLTDISGWVDDPPITITCTAGYVLDIGVLQKEIVCISVDGNPTWNDTVGLCQTIDSCFHVSSTCDNVSTSGIGVLLPIRLYNVGPADEVGV
ncbi:hypothetical protein ACF0H5_012354 [Mactra antiquata]